MSKRGKRPGVVQVIKDLVTYSSGVLIIFKEAGIGFDPPAQVSDSLIVLAIILIGVPGASQLALAKFGKGTSTGGQQPQRARSESPASSHGGRRPTD